MSQPDFDLPQHQSSQHARELRVALDTARLTIQKLPPGVGEALKIVRGDQLFFPKHRPGFVRLKLVPTCARPRDFWDKDLCMRSRPIRGAGEASIIVMKRTVRGWLTGPHRAELVLELAADLPAGSYGLAIGLVGPRDRGRAVRLANLGRDPAGWYPVSTLEIVL